MLRLAILSALLMHVPHSATTRPASVDFTVHFDGRGAEGVDDIWRGSLGAPDAGVIALRIEHLSHGAIHAQVFVSHDNVARSFGADVAGTIDGAGMLHLTGTVDVGANAGAAVDVTAHLDGRQPEGRGTIRFLPVTASR